MDVPLDVIDKARKVFDRAEDQNSMTWSGPYVDSILAVVQAVWDEAYSSGHKGGRIEGYDDGYEEGAAAYECDHG